MSIFHEASFFTLDDRMKNILIKCGRNIFPSEFKVMNGFIITKTGNNYPIPKDPMALYNLIHDIMHGREPAQKMAASSVPHRQKTICPDAIDMYAMTKARDGAHKEKISSCIYTALYMGYIDEKDFIYSGNIISHINGIDTDVPAITRNT